MSENFCWAGGLVSQIFRFQQEQTTSNKIPALAKKMVRILYLLFDIAQYFRYPTYAIYINGESGETENVCNVDASNV